MRLIAVKKGKTVEDITDKLVVMSKISCNVKTIEEPTKDALYTLRNLIDPYGMVSRGKNI